MGEHTIIQVEEDHLIDASRRPEEDKSIKSFMEAYKNDNFSRFRELLKSNAGFLKVKKRKLAFHLIAAIVKSNTVQPNYASKYISLVLITFDEVNDKELFSKTDENDKTLMKLVEESRSIEIMISALMPDWFEATSHDDKKYFLVEKFAQYGGEKLVFDRLYCIFSGKNHHLLIYRDACLRIIYRFFLEQEDFDTLNDKRTVLSVESVNLDKLHSTEDFDPEYKRLILEVFAVFWPSSDETLDERIFISGDFFHMAKLLKNHQSVEFQESFEKLISEAKLNFGYYFKISLKHHVRLLEKIASREEKLIGALEFIHEKFQHIEVNSTILANFYAVKDFKVLNVFPFKNKNFQRIVEKTELDDLVLKDLKKIICSYKNDESEQSKELRKMLFGRRNINEMSLFERILSTPNSSDLIKNVWEKFEFSSKEEILSMENLLKYVIESGDDKNITKFLMPQCSHEQDFSERSSYMKYNNHQHLVVTEGKFSLFERHLITCLRNKENELISTSFITVYSLLEEMDKFGILIENKTIDKIIDLANDPQFYSKLGINSSELEKDLKRQKLYVDDVLAYLVIYSKDKDSIKKLKEKLLKPAESSELTAPTTEPTLNESLFQMIFEVMDGEEDLFIKSFYGNLKKLEDACRIRYGKPSAEDDKKQQTIESYVKSYLWILLWAAVIHNRRSIINHLMDYEGFVTMHLRFPENIRCTDTCLYIAKKFLENGHELGQDELPKSWISHSDFGKFLDSRITSQNTDLIELDCKILLHTNTKKYRVNRKEDVDNKLIYSEDTKSLNYIMNDEKLRSFVTHPVIATYINLKAHKHQKIYLWNLRMFVLLFILPFASLFTIFFKVKTLEVNMIISFSSILFLIFPEVFMILRAQKKDCEKVFEVLDPIPLQISFIFVWLISQIESLSSNLWFCWGSVLFLILREVFQYFAIDRDREKYLRKASNWADIFLIFSSILTLIALQFQERHSTLLIASMMIITALLMLIISLWIIFTCINQKTSKHHETSMWLYRTFALFFVIPFASLFTIFFEFKTSEVNWLIMSVSMLTLLGFQVFMIKRYWKRYCNVQSITLEILTSGLSFIVVWLISQIESLSLNLWVCWFSISFLIWFLVFRTDATIDATESEKCWRKFFNNWDKLILILVLIVLSVVTLICVHLETNYDETLNVLIIINKFSALTVLLTAMPSSRIAIFMIMIRKCCFELVYTIRTVAFIFFAITTSFCILFRSNENFVSFSSAFLKVIEMSTGEYATEPNSLSLLQRMYFFIFLLSTFFMLNLIQGVVFDDVQRLKKNASRLILEHNAMKFVATSEAFNEFYYNHYELDKNTEDLKFIPRCLVNLSKGLIAKNPFLHKIGKIYINKKTMMVITEVNRKQVSVMDEAIDDAIFEEILAVINELRN